MGNFSFFEYSYNSIEKDPAELFANLTTLGFVCRSRHIHSNVTVWAQNRCIFLLKDNHEYHGEGITGLGLMISQDQLDECFEARIDPYTDFYVLSNEDNSFNFYLLPANGIDQFADNYMILDDKQISNPGFDHFSGFVIDTDDASTIEIINRMSKSSSELNNYTRYLLPNNQFSIFVENNSNSGVGTVVIDTNDIFKSTSHLLLKQVELMEFEDEEGNSFGKLAHKINGYNCKAFGNENSYSIENYIPKGSVNFNIIFRERKQYIKIREETLQYYDSVNTNQKK